MRKVLLAVIALGALVDTASAEAPAPRMVAMTKTTAVCGQAGEEAVVVHLDREVAALEVFWRSSRERRVARAEPDAGGFLIARRTCDAASSIPYDELDRGVVLGLTAVDADGARHPVENVPVMVDVDELRGPKRRMRVETADLVPLPAAPAPRERTHGAIPLALIGVAIVIGARKGRAEATSAASLPAARASRRRAAT